MTTTGFVQPAGDGPNAVDYDCTATPSAQNILYSYDNPGVFPNHFPACNVRDYAYNEFDFTYYLTIKIGNASVTCTTEIGCITEMQKTGASTWGGIKNAASSTSVPDCIITVNKIDGIEPNVISPYIGDYSVWIDSNANLPNPNP